MHPEIISICLFWFVVAFTPGPNNIVASYSGFNFGIIKTIPHMCGVILGFTTLVALVNFGLIKIFINPKFITITKVVNPNITPHICGMVLANPKLNPE